MPKPKNHLYIHPLSKDKFRQAKLEQVLNSATAARTIAIRAKLPIVQRYAMTWLNVPCFMNPTHTVPERDPGPLLLLDTKIECQPGEHDISPGALVDFIVKGEVEALDDLLAKFNFEPELPRSYCFETEDGRRSVADDQLDALMGLGAKPTEKVRGIAIECESLTLAKQLCGQEGTRKKFNWREDVPRTATGLLTDAGWHRAYLTNREQVLDRRLRAAAETAERDAKERLLESFRAEIGL